MPAKIILENMEFYAYHGCYTAERNIGATYFVTVEMTLNADNIGQNDILDETVNYETVYRLVASEMEQPSNLIEHVAYRIKTTLRAQLPQIADCLVRVSKMAPPLGGKVERATVEM